MDSLKPFPVHLKLSDFICPYFPLLNQSMAGDNNEEFPFAIVPVLSFGGAGAADID